MSKINSVFRQQIALPQDHGSWVFILSPLAIGLSTGGNVDTASQALIFAAMLAFLIRQPITVAIKAFSGRRPRTDLPAAYFWIFIYSCSILLASIVLITLDKTFVFYLVIPAIPVFGWHLWLVSKRDERRQIGIEILGTGVLALVAPATFWLGKGSYSPVGWVLWLLIWFQSAASIVYAYLRLEQRQSKPFSNSGLREKIKPGYRAISYAILNLLISFILGRLNIIPAWVFLAPLIQTLEVFWGLNYPAIGKKPVAIGIRQLVISSLFTLVFIITWR